MKITAATLLAALELPAAARVDRRVPKSLLIEHGARTPADRRRINEGIERVQWVAALKPATIGVAEYRDDSREYLEIAVLTLAVRAPAKLDRMVELLHRAVPYPVVAVTENGERAHLSLAHKRWSQGEVGKTVLDGEIVAVDSTAMDGASGTAFLSALALGRQPAGSLFVLYQGWIDTLLALRAAHYNNDFSVPQTPERSATRRDALGECERLTAAIARLCAAAAREKQLPKQVQLNLELKRLKAERAAALARL